MLPFFQCPVLKLFAHYDHFCLFTFYKRGFLIAMHPLIPAYLNRLFNWKRHWLLLRGNKFNYQLCKSFLFMYFAIHKQVFSIYYSCHFWCSSSFSVNIFASFLLSFLRISHPMSKNLQVLGNFSLVPVFFKWNINFCSQISV